MSRSFDALRAERDCEAAGRQAALLEVTRLQAEVVRLQARLQIVEDAETASPVPASPRLRGLASLLDPYPAQGA